MATKKALTARGVEALAADPVARREVADGGIAGLYVVIQPSGAKSWAVRYRFEGKPRKATLGAWPRMGLADARRAALAALARVAAGDDPGRVEAEPDRDLFRVVAAEFLKRHAANKRTEPAMRRTLEKDIIPAWGERRIDEISKRDVIEILDGVVDRGAPVQANRVLAVIRKLFAWAVSRDVLAVSPCAGVKPPTPETRRDRVLSDDEIRAFWRATAAQGWPFGPMARMLLITGQRLSEVANMTRGEVHGAVWTIPASRAKNGREHQVPLSVPALLILAAAPRIGGEFVFTTTGQGPVSGFGAAKRRLDALMEGDPARWTFHDLRRTCATGMARAGAPVAVIERGLNHVSGAFAGVAGVYNRHNYAQETRRAADAWAALLLEIVGENRADNVVSLRR